jgi:hypothetical protein
MGYYTSTKLDGITSWVELHPRHVFVLHVNEHGTVQAEVTRSGNSRYYATGKDLDNVLDSLAGQMHLRPNRYPYGNPVRRTRVTVSNQKD